MGVIDTDTTIPARPLVESRERRVLAMGTGGRRLLAAALVVGLVVLAFFAGRSYQNNIDQKLFNDYNPPATTSRGGLGAGAGLSGAGFAAGGSSTNAQVRAALSAGSPPGSSTTGGSGSSGASGGNAAAGSSGGAAAAGAVNRVVGSLSSISQNSLSVQSFQGGTQSVALTPQTKFYQTVTASTSALQPGEHVTIQATGSTSQPSALSITIGPIAAGGGGRFGGGGFGGFGGTPTTRISGNITKVGSGTISVSGSAAPVAITSTTRISRTVSIQPSQVKSGGFVTVTLGTVGGKQVATTVIARNSAFGGGGFGGGFSGGSNG